MATDSQHSSRRRFLRSAGAAAVGATMAGPLRALAQEAAGARQIRIGVVGGGFGASFHWHQHPGCVVAAVSDLRPDRRQHLMNTYQCDKSYESLEVLIQDNTIAAVAVFTEAPNHVRHCTAVMDTGKHCISAVPAATTLEDCAKLLEAKTRNGVRYMMAETSYYRWPTITMRQMVADGTFGEIRYCEAEYYHPGIGAAGDGLSTWNGERTWRYGYAPMLYPTHSTAFLVGVTRERLTSVSCLGTRGADAAFHDNVYGNPFDNCSALFTTDRGNMFRCNVMWNVWSHGERAQWCGEHTAFFMDGWAGQPQVLCVAGQANVAAQPDYWHMVPETMRVDSGHGASHPFLTNEFIMALLEDREPTVNIHEALAFTAPGIVAHQSAFRDGERLAVPSFDPA